MRYLSPIGTRLSQAQGLRRIAWRNPVTRGLRLLLSLRNNGDLVNLVTGQRATATSSLGNGVTQFGRGALFGSGGYVDFVDPGGISGTTPVTFVWRQEYRNPVDFNTVLNWKPPGATNAFAIYQGVNSGYRFACGPRAGTVPFFDREAPADGQVDTYVLVVAGGTDNATNSNYALFRNGIKSTPSSTTAFGTNTTASARIGALDSGGDPFEGFISDFGIIARALTDAEAASLSRNINQLYEPDARVFYAIQALGGGGLNYTMSAGGSFTLSGAVALIKHKVMSASGSIAFSGTRNILRERIMSAGGQVALSGSAPFVNTAQYTMSAGGTVNFQGGAPVLKQKIMSVSGQVSFGGSAPMIFIPAGGSAAAAPRNIFIGVGAKNRIS